MKLDEAQNGNHTSYGRQAHSARVGLTSRFFHWPTQKRAAIPWILDYLVHYLPQTHRLLSLRDYTDFLKRSLWKVYQQARTRPKQGRYCTCTYSIPRISDATYCTWPPPAQLRGKILFPMSSPEPIDALNNN